MDALPDADVFLFEGFRLDLRGGDLLRRDGGGVLVRLPIGSRALEILEVLVRRSGDLVTRDEIMKVVWPKTVVENSNLPVQIAALRRLLDDGRSDGSCIQTVPGRGYRFILPVTPVEPSAPLITTQPSASSAGSGIVEEREPQRAPAPSRFEDTPPTALPPERRRRRRSILATLAAALSVLAAVVTVQNWHQTVRSEARPVPRLSIVVLPFTNLGNDSNHQYFAEGITEDLTTDLSRLADMFVISRDTAFTYKDKPVNAKQIGRELGVRYVLEGSVQRFADQIGINARLIDAETDAHLWAERFDRDIRDLFALQNEITGRIVVALSAELVSVEAARLTVRPGTLDYIFRGRAALLKPPSRDTYAEAVGIYERAFAFDPLSVAAQSGLALTLAARVLDDMTDSRASDISRAEGLALQALAASPRSPVAHFARGQVLRASDRWEEAIPEYETALALNRNLVSAISGLAACKLRVRPIEEVIPLQTQALRLSPRDPNVGNMYLRIGRSHFLQSHTDEAIVWLEKARDADPVRYGPHASLAAAYALKGETDRAAVELAEARRLVGDDRFSSITRLKALGSNWAPKVLLEATFWAGLRKAGMPEE